MVPEAETPSTAIAIEGQEVEEVAEEAVEGAPRKMGIFPSLLRQLLFWVVRLQYMP